MGSLSAAISTSLMEADEAPDYHQRRQHSGAIAGRGLCLSVQRSASAGIGDRLAPESVIDMVRNRNAAPIRTHGIVPDADD
jgi:hypothetical protein